MKNKEITIYELIGLIKDGKAPKKIKIKENVFELIVSRYYLNKEFLVDNDLFYKITLGYITLDDTVEILPEENDEWEDIEECSKKDFLDLTLDERTIELYYYVRDLIKNQKYLKEKLENKND